MQAARRVLWVTLGRTTWGQILIRPPKLQPLARFLLLAPGNRTMKSVSALCSTDEDTLDDLADSSTEADSALLAGAVALESLLVARRGLVLGSALEESRLARATSSGEKGVASVREPSHMRMPPASRVRRGARIEWP